MPVEQHGIIRCAAGGDLYEFFLHPKSFCKIAVIGNKGTAMPTRNNTGTARLLMSAAGIALAVAGPAMAQTNAAVPEAATAGPTGGIDEIVVTAQRRAERLQDVPISISAFNQAELRRSDTNDLSRLTNMTAGFNFGKSGFDARPAIRGVRTENVAGNGDPTIGFYVDDIYQSRSVQAGQPFVDVQRVEVQRGPQGTLFGRNTYGGAISVITAVPGSEPDFGIEGIYGNYDRRQVQGFVSVPLTDTFGIRIAADYEKRDGFVKNIAVNGNDLYDKDTQFVRGTARWAPTSELEVVVRGNYWHEGGNGGQAFGYKPAGILYDPVNLRRSLTTGTFVPYVNSVPLDGIPDINGIDIGTRVDPNPYTTQTQLPSKAKLDQYAGSGQIRWQNDDIFLRSITSYQKFDYYSNAGDVVGVSATRSVQNRSSDAFSQELQIGGSQTKPLQWIAGLFYFNDKVVDEFRSERTDLNDGFNGSGFPNTAKVRSYAGYAQASYFVTDAFRLTAGGRYTIDDKDFASQGITIIKGVDTITPNSTFAGGKKFKKFTWRAGADYFVRPENMIYGNVSKGFRSGGFNGAAFTNPLIPFSFDPETVTAYEVGAKNRFLDDRVQLNLAAYYNDFRGLQIQNGFLSGTPPVLLSTIRNAGKAYARGVEIEAVVRPVAQLTVNITAAFVKTKYQDYDTTRPGGYAVPPGESPIISLAGNQIPYTPASKVTVGGRYDFVTAIGTFTPSANIVMSGKYYNTDYNTVIDVQRSFEKLDLRLAWLAKGDHLGVDLFVNNVANVAVANRGVFGSQGLNKSFEEPRFYGVRLSIRK